MSDTQQQVTTLTLEKALNAHVNWKRKLLNASNSGQPLDIESIKRDDCCDLGRWLHSDGRRLYQHLPEFQRLMLTHQEFHQVTGIVANMINSKDSESAKVMLSGSSQFTYASMEVGLAINALKAAAARTPQPGVSDSEG